MMKQIIISTHIFLLFFLTVEVRSQNLYNARSLSMAGSNVAITEGNEYIGGNPAVLALPRHFNFEILLVSAHAMLRNNSYSLTEYDRYFTTGDSLSSSDIDFLASRIPDNGLKGEFNTDARALAFYARPFSLSIGGMGNGFVNFPKDAARIPFYGNTEIKEFKIDDLDGEAWAGGSLDFGIAFPITEWTPAEFDFFSVGLTAKYIVGFQYANIENSSGTLITTDDYLLVDAMIETRRSEGGSGWGVDLGILGIYEEDWTLSLHFSNILGEIFWNKENKIDVIEYEADSLFHIEEIANFADKRIDTTLSIGRFGTGLPRSATFSTAYRLQPNLVLTGSYRQGFNEELGNTTIPRVAGGVEYAPVPFVPLRAGIAVGGKSSFSLGLGFGIDLKYWQLNIGYLNHNFRWFRGARSVDVAVTTQFRF
ncbi:MAG: hypothetical protein JSW33_08920 [bacterium]|nr:MAG: hypothetical protein JSW33_08920 [bacterium]